MAPIDVNKSEYSDFGTYFGNIRETNRFMYALVWGSTKIMSQTTQNVLMPEMNMTIVPVMDPINTELNTPLR